MASVLGRDCGRIRPAARSIEDGREVLGRHFAHQGDQSPALAARQAREESDQFDAFGRVGDFSEPTLGVECPDAERFDAVAFDVEAGRVVVVFAVVLDVFDAAVFDDQDAPLRIPRMAASARGT